MERYFTKGSRIPLQNGQSAEVIAKLGEGGQGTVYRVRIGGKEYALKWYHKGTLQNPRRFYQNLENNIRQGAPSPAFLWSEFLTKERDGSFGYVMKLRPSNYREFSDFLLAKVHFSSLSAAANVALNITNGFRELHRKGFAQTNDQTAVSQLKDYLPTLSEKGSGDDMSVGIIVNTDFARQKTAAFEKSRQASQNEVTP